VRGGWLIAAVLLFVAAASTWFAFQSPEFLAALGTIAATAVWKAVAPAIAQRMTPEEEAEFRREQRAGRGDEWLKKWHRRKG